MNIDFIISMVPQFGAAALITLGISVGSIVGGVVLGFLVHGLYRAFPRVLKKAYGWYVWVIRGTPFLAQLFVIYYGLPSVGFTPTAVQATIGGLALYASAYFAEIFRSAWSAIPRGQAEAACSLGISPLAIFAHIEAPQALRFAIPLIVNQAILILKESSVASIITVPELTMTAGILVAENFLYVEPYLLLALTYWFLTHVVSEIGRQFEQRINLRQRGGI